MSEPQEQAADYFTIENIGNATTDRTREMIANLREYMTRTADMSYRELVDLHVPDPDGSTSEEESGREMEM